MPAGSRRFLDDAGGRTCGDGASSIRLGTPITGVRKQGDGLLVETANGSQAYDAVISTSSPALMARLAPDLPDSYSAEPAEAQVDGRGRAGRLARPLAARTITGTTCPKRPGSPSWRSWSTRTSWIAEHYGGDHIIYCGDYLETDHEYFPLSKEELLERFLPAFSRFNPTVRPQLGEGRLALEDGLRPACARRSITRRTSPPLRTPVPGLYFASMSQVYPWDRGTNFAVEIGRRVAGLAMEDLSKTA